MGAKCDRLSAACFGQESPVHVIFQGGRGQLSEVILGLVLIEQLDKFGPAHPLGISIDDFERVSGVEQGGHLGQGNLGPDHVLTCPAAHTVLGADP
jgi:hypothetical protein